MRTIHKYKLGTPGEPFTVEMPEAALDRRFDYLQERFWLWAEVDTDKPKEFQFQSVILGTGWPIPDGFEYHATCFSPGDFVWHLFFKGKE